MLRILLFSLSSLSYLCSSFSKALSIARRLLSLLLILLSAPLEAVISLSIMFRIAVKDALKPFLLRLSLVISAAHSSSDSSLMYLKMSSLSSIGSMTAVKVLHQCCLCQMETPSGIDRCFELRPFIHENK